MEIPLIAQDRGLVRQAMLQVQKKMDVVSSRNQDKLPYTTGADGRYDDRSRGEYAVGEGCSWWTNGFWGGLLWQMYYRTRQDKYRRYAIRCEEKLDACFEEYWGLNHDVGFMWLPTAVIHHRLVPNEESRKRGLRAADFLLSRFNPAGEFLRAWNDLPGEDTRGWAIIDCMMNIPLLYWASRETKDPCYAHAARCHAETVRKSFMREDGSFCHIVEFDPETGARLRSHGGQGYAHGSAWTRGQGWALYGFARSYCYCGKPSHLRTAESVAQYCISQIRGDGFIPIDFRQPEDSILEDNCGACVIACGMLELAGLTKDRELAQQCIDTAMHILRRVLEQRCDWSESCDAIVQQCAASWYNSTPITMNYADYFLVEALLRLEGRELTIF